MRSALPGKSSQTTAVGLTKVALRLLKLSDLADAISDLTGLGGANIESLVLAAEKDIANRPSAEFTAVTSADRDWIEGMLARAYMKVAEDPGRRVMRDGLVGAESVALLVDQALSTHDREELGAASDDMKAYFAALSLSIAYLISEWYSTNQEARSAAMASAAGETLHTVRTIPNLIEELRIHLDSSLAKALSQLEPPSPGRTSLLPEPEPDRERIVFELDFGLAPLANDTELSELVSAAVVAVLEDKPLSIEIRLPNLDDDAKFFGDAVRVAQVKRQRLRDARRIQLNLSAFFSPQVESAWATYLPGIPARVTVLRSILAGQEATQAKLDVWRTAPPLASAPIWLEPREVEEVLESVQLSDWNYLRGGPGWRAADELPRSVIVGKVMSSILAELVRREVTMTPNWSADVLALPSWHIGQG